MQFRNLRAWAVSKAPGEPFLAQWRTRLCSLRLNDVSGSKAAFLTLSRLRTLDTRGISFQTLRPLFVNCASSLTSLRLDEAPHAEDFSVELPHLSELHIGCDAHLTLTLLHSFTAITSLSTDSWPFSTRVSRAWAVHFPRLAAFRSSVDIDMGVVDWLLRHSTLTCLDLCDQHRVLTLPATKPLWPLLRSLRINALSELHAL